MLRWFQEVRENRYVNPSTTLPHATGDWQAKTTKTEGKAPWVAQPRVAWWVWALLQHSRRACSTARVDEESGRLGSWAPYSGLGLVCHRASRGGPAGNGRGT